MNSLPIAAPGGSSAGVLSVVSRYRILIGLSIACGIAVMFLVYTLMPRQYVGEAVLALNVRRAQVLPTEAVVAPQLPDALEIRTELDAIASRSMTERVLARIGPVPAEALPRVGLYRGMVLRMIDLLPGRWAWPQALKAKLVSDATSTKDDLVGRVLDGLHVVNDGRSYTIYISFSASTPEFAAKVAEAYADEYVARRSNLIGEVARDASDWLGSKLDNLRAKLEASETAVESYRRSTGLTDQDGSPLLTQMLTALNTEVAGARAAAAGAQARLQTVLALRQAQPGTQSFPEALNSAVIQELRREETQTLQSIGQLEEAGSIKSAQLPLLHAQLSLVQQRIQDEVERTIAGLRAEVQADDQKVSQLEQALADARQRSINASQAAVYLKQLEREAAANRSVYETFLNRYKQTIEQVNFESPDARLLTAAQTPGWPASPNLLPLLMLGVAAGGGVGIGLSFWLDRKDARVRFVRELEDLFQVPVLGIVSDARLPRIRWSSERFLKAEPKKALCGLATTLEFYQPTSHATVLAVTSILPREGKTTFCAALGRTIARSGRKVVVVETKAGRSGLATVFGRGSDVADDLTMPEKPVQAALKSDKRSPAHFIRAASLATDNGFLRRDLLDRLIASLKQRYDVVLIDAPALSEGAESVQLAAASDAVLLVARLAMLKRAAALDALHQLALCDIAIAGIIALGLDEEVRKSGRVWARPTRTARKDEAAPQRLGKLNGAPHALASVGGLTEPSEDLSLRAAI